MMRTADNVPTFEPLAISDPAFLAWATRVGLRLLNVAPGAPDEAIELSITCEGAPRPEWAQALLFLMSLAQSNKRKP